LASAPNNPPGESARGELLHKEPSQSCTLDQKVPDKFGLPVTGYRDQFYRMLESQVRSVLGI
jgi:hypothetical protein